MKKNILIGTPVIRLKLQVSFAAMSDLSSFERLVLALVDRCQKTEQELKPLLPFENSLSTFVVGRLLNQDLLSTNGSGQLALSKSGGKTLESSRILKKFEQEVEVYFDPMIGRFVTKDKLDLNKKNFDYWIKLERYSNDEIKKIIPKQDLANFVDDDDCVLDQKLVTSVEILNVTTLTSGLELNYESVPGESLHSEFLSKGESYPVSMGDYLAKGMDLNLQIPGPLLEELTMVKEQQEQLYKYLMTAQADEDPIVQEKISQIHSTLMSYDMIVDSQHSKALEKFIQDAKREIYVASGWVKFSVVDRIYGLLVSKLKDPDIEVHFLFGYAKNGNVSNPDALGRLKDLQNKFSNLHLHEVHDEFHCKALVVDCEVASIGSHNWLSNTARSSKEWSVVVRDANFAKDIKERLFLPAIQNKKRQAI